MNIFFINDIEIPRKLFQAFDLDLSKRPTPNSLLNFLKNINLNERSPLISYNSFFGEEQYRVGKLLNKGAQNLQNRFGGQSSPQKYQHGKVNIDNYDIFISNNESILQNLSHYFNSTYL